MSEDVCPNDLQALGPCYEPQEVWDDKTCMFESSREANKRRGSETHGCRPLVYNRAEVENRAQGCGGVGENQ